ncbi:hypothetical protein [uncultured Hyphomicrobium sp.]|jgi:hypothetical protein|uniref:hypothetical protein n=1 Tax=uncultured Hyphomicrobium sp. TaxID=194373 RepID=UPI0025DB8C4C|nr:hypothetical protein [uncultured Hyphomicrobium sp.]
MTALNYAHTLAIGRVQHKVSGASNTGTFAYVQMMLKPANGRMELIELRFPQGFDHSQINDGEIWQLLVDIRPRFDRRGVDNNGQPNRVMTGLAYYVVDTGPLAHLNRKIDQDDEAGFADVA